MMIVIWFALYITIGVGVLWVMLKTLDDTCPEIMELSAEKVAEQYKENIKRSATKRGAKIRWFITRRVMPLLIWPLVVLITVIASYIGKLKGEL